MRDIQFPGRSPVQSTKAMAATSHPASTLAAIDILRAGGNAVDAAIAACAVQCVVEPQSTGIGGDCFMLYAPAGGDKVIAMNGSGRAPAAAEQGWYAEQGIDRIGFQSVHAITVPGAIAAWQKLSDDHGRLGLDRTLQQAIDYAENGYVVHQVVAHVWQNSVEKLSADATCKAIFLPGGKPPAMGDIHRQPALAETLGTIAAKGRDGFYTGAIAEDMVKTLRAQGGLHTLDDFAAASADYVTPIATDYHGTTVHECPPNGQGILVLMLLNMLAGDDLAALDPLGPERFHLEAEAAKLVYRDRAALIADPAKADVPVDTLLSKDYAAAMRRLIDPGRAATTLPPPGQTEHKDTVYLCVVDEDGNTISFINSLFQSFGTAIASPTGVLFHNRGSGFALDPAHPNCIAPGKRPMHTIIPGMMTRGGRAVMPFGVMGGHFQPVGQTHFATNVLNYGMDVQAALDLPRAFAFEGQVRVERGVPKATLAGLAARGHEVVETPFPLGGGQAIAIDHERGVLTGGSDPRKDGCAMGY